MIGSNLASAGFGLLFWIAAARRYSTTNVGIDTALISIMNLLSNVATLNLNNAFNRFVPTAGNRTARFVGSGYLLTGALAAVASAAFVVGIQLGAWAPTLRVVIGRHADAVWFVVATMLWTIFGLQDAVLAGLGESPWVLIENVSYGILKLFVLLAVAEHLPRSGVFIAWTAPLLLFVVAMNMLLFGRLIPRRREPASQHITAKVVGRFVSADYPASMMNFAVVGVMPLLAITITGSVKSSAYVYIAWTFAYTLFFVSTNVGMSMITEAARAPERLSEFARRTTVHALRIVIPLAAILVAGAPYVLRIAGSDYASHATRLLQLFALAAIPNVFFATKLNVLRAQRRTASVLGLTAVQSLAVLVLSIVLLHLVGTVGIGIAWLTTQSLFAATLIARRAYEGAVRAN